MFGRIPERHKLRRGIDYDGVHWAVYRPALDAHKPDVPIRNADCEVARIDAGMAPAHNTSPASIFREAISGWRRAKVSAMEYD
jgi:hypothetical protein